MAALRARGHKVASAKVGPDYIDPSYHSLATGRPGRNLDPWICGLESIGPLAGRAAANAEVLVVEGVMGLFDGAADGEPSSTADVAEALDAPIVLVVDGSAMSGSIAALVRGFRDHRQSLNVAGVVLNRVNGERHRVLLTEALASIDVPVLGCVAKDENLTWRDRHLGLVPVAEDAAGVAKSLERLAAVIEQQCDVKSILEIANSATRRTERQVRLAVDHQPSSEPVRIAVAGGSAFTFNYVDNLEALRSAGAQIVFFNPLKDERLPESIKGLIVGGGFPEVFTSRLSENANLLSNVRQRISEVLVTWVECGGLLWLSSSVDGQSMVGALEAKATMRKRLTLGYRTALVERSNPLAEIGQRLRGHEFHYSNLDEPGDALVLESRFSERSDGFASRTMLATYLHQHLGDQPERAARFVQTCRGGRNDA